MQRLTDEGARVSGTLGSPYKGLKDVRERYGPFESALRDWIESQLPKSRTALDAEFPSLEARMHAALDNAGLVKPNAYDFPPGFVAGVTLTRPEEGPEFLVVVAGVGIPCGRDDAVYIYDYGRQPPLRVLESHASRDHDEAVSGVKMSTPDAAAEYLVLTLRYAVQCASNWNELSYDVFRLSPRLQAADRVLSDSHGYFGHDYEVRLQPKDLLLQFRGGSIDTDILIRTFVRHYDLSGPTPQRIDPVALLPRDFVDEWLTSTWDEMEARSASSARDALRKWHELLDGASGHFSFVQTCEKNPGQWQIGMDLGKSDQERSDDPGEVFFLVQAMPEYRFQMTGISFTRQEGCPGESDPEAESPSLFPETEK
ncbi:MAG: hypothetical protein ABSB67_02340 [Bryobacteraceae bacterium]|jgi:hypothetical protein